MSDPNFVLLYVSDPLTAADFFADLLGKPPVEASPGFAMFALDSGVMLGLWERGGCRARGHRARRRRAGLCRR